MEVTLKIDYNSYERKAIDQLKILALVAERTIEDVDQDHGTIEIIIKSEDYDNKVED